MCIEDLIKKYDKSDPAYRVLLRTRDKLAEGKINKKEAKDIATHYFRTNLPEGETIEGGIEILYEFHES